MSDFSDRPFVAGSLIGLRAFSIDRLGRLIGPSFAQVFRPGENEAECRKGSGLSFSTMVRAYSSLTMPPSMFAFDPIPASFQYAIKSSTEEEVAEEAVQPPEPEPHSLAGVKCSCGFYAYFDGRNDYKDPTRVTAVVEGYGVCTIGDRGFRAAKARLVALVEPKTKVSPMLREYLHRNYDGTPFYATKGEALDAHPLTPPPIGTPDDEDFWTREVPR